MLTFATLFFLALFVIGCSLLWYGWCKKGRDETYITFGAILVGIPTLIGLLQLFKAD
jgi:hypothetical protein